MSGWNVRQGRLGVAIALVALVIGGCATSTATRPPLSSDPGAPRPPAAESPTNFASPTDLFQRYPTMRRQEL